MCKAAIGLGMGKLRLIVKRQLWLAGPLVGLLSIGYAVSTMDFSHEPHNATWENPQHIEGARSPHIAGVEAHVSQHIESSHRGTESPHIAVCGVSAASPTPSSVSSNHTPVRCFDANDVVGMCLYRDGRKTVYFNEETDAILPAVISIGSVQCYNNAGLHICMDPNSPNTPLGIEMKKGSGRMKPRLVRSIRVAPSPALFRRSCVRSAPFEGPEQVPFVSSCPSSR